MVFSDKGEIERVDRAKNKFTIPVTPRFMLDEDFMLSTGISRSNSEFFDFRFSIFGFPLCTSFDFDFCYPSPSSPFPPLHPLPLLIHSFREEAHRVIEATCTSGEVNMQFIQQFSDEIYYYTGPNIGLIAGA